MKTEQAELMAKALIEVHKLNCGFEWIPNKTIMGRYISSKNVIQLSKPLVQLNNENTVRDTIIHEIAHAIAGVEAGHGRLWKVTALRLGGSISRCTASDVVKVPSKRVLVCISCSHEVPVYRSRKTTKACGKCCRIHNGGRFDERFKLIERVKE